MHCRGVDRADLTDLKSCYWPEANVVYGESPVSAHEFCETLVVGIKNYAQTHHVVSNSLIRFPRSHAPTSAAVKTYLTAYHYLASEDEADREMIYLGRYWDQFEKRGDHWKIIHRMPIMNWSQNAAASHDTQHPALAAPTRAGRCPDDPIY